MHNQIPGMIQKECFLYDDLHRLCTKLNISLSSDDTEMDNTVGVKRIKMELYPALAPRTTPRRIAPAPPHMSDTSHVMLQPMHQIIATIQTPPTAIDNLHSEFQILDTGQEQRFKRFIEMCERHHKEKMEALDQIISLLTNT